MDQSVEMVISRFIDFILNFSSSFSSIHPFKPMLLWLILMEIMLNDWEKCDYSLF